MNDHDHEAPNQNDPCEHIIYMPALDKTRVCGASWTSVVHPPNQYRHWCAILEAGGDCGHEEGF